MYANCLFPNEAGSLFSDLNISSATGVEPAELLFFCLPNFYISVDTETRTEAWGWFRPKYAARQECVLCRLVTENLFQSFLPFFVSCRKSTKIKKLPLGKGAFRWAIADLLNPSSHSQMIRIAWRSRRAMHCARFAAWRSTEKWTIKDFSAYAIVSSLMPNFSPSPLSICGLESWMSRFWIISADYSPVLAKISFFMPADKDSLMTN